MVSSLIVKLIDVHVSVSTAKSRQIHKKPRKGPTQLEQNVPWRVKKNLRDRY